MTARQEVVLQQHPLSAAFPAMPEADLAALAEDIKKNGQREKGILLNGMVLDGWHRYLACKQVNEPFIADDFEGDDPIAYVLSKNLHRRHLTASQRAAAVVSAHNWRPHGDQDSRSAPGADRTTKEMAKEAEVGTRTIEHAKDAERAGLGDDVREGRVSAKAAAQVAKLPPQKRAKAMKAIKEGRAPTPPKEKKPAGDTEKLTVRISVLETQLAETKESLGDMADLAASAKVFEDKSEFKEMQVLRLELRSCKRRRDELMRENDQLKTEVKRWRKKAEGK